MKRAPVVRLWGSEFGSLIFKFKFCSENWLDLLRGGSEFKSWAVLINNYWLPPPCSVFNLVYVVYICVISLKLFEWRAYELASIQLHFNYEQSIYQVISNALFVFTNALKEFIHQLFIFILTVDRATHAN